MLNQIFAFRKIKFLIFLALFFLAEVAFSEETPPPEKETVQLTAKDANQTLSQILEDINSLPNVQLTVNVEQLDIQEDQLKRLEASVQIKDPEIHMKNFQYHVQWQQVGDNPPVLLLQSTGETEKTPFQNEEMNIGYSFSHVLLYLLKWADVSLKAAEGNPLIDDLKNAVTITSSIPVKEVDKNCDVKKFSLDFSIKVDLNKISNNWTKSFIPFLELGASSSGQASLSKGDMVIKLNPEFIKYPDIQEGIKSLITDFKKISGNPEKIDKFKKKSSQFYQDMRPVLQQAFENHLEILKRVKESMPQN